MSNDVRNKLFQSIIMQDIAFFDGITTGMLAIHRVCAYLHHKLNACWCSTGELTSRLSSDANAMTQPCQTVLGDLLSNGLTLLGSIFMCFYTSWKLSVLAITSIGPIVQITRAYARWSRNINREIWAALGDASTVANQAITNIRTVRAFGAEKHEADRYMEATGEAVSRSVKDSCASAGTYAMTNYLDLGTGVLLLWYGGETAMEVS